MRNKRRLTQTLIESLPLEQQPDLDDVMSVWWYNLRQSGGLRLTILGYEAFCNLLELEHYRFCLTELDLRAIMALDRYLQSPYYINIQKKIPTDLMLFGSQEAVMVNLYGNLQQYLDNHRS